MSKKLVNQLVNELSSLDDLSVKTFFGGFSLNSQAAMFGWIDQAEFYLRGHADYRSLFIELGMEPLSLPAGVTIKLLDYYRVHKSLLENRQKLLEMVTMVIQYAIKDKTEKIKLKELRIKELPNMTLSLERSLFTVGVIDIEIFQQVGHLEAFFRIKKKNDKVSNNILFMLYGALHGCHVGTLSTSTKKEIELSYQYFLEKNDKIVICH